MKWVNVKLIWSREIRDQLRDRRTLFMIAVLPLLLYPLLGMTFLQVAQFMRKHPTKILVVGAAELPDRPKLIDKNGEGGRFASYLCPNPADVELLVLSIEPDQPKSETKPADPIAAAKDAVTAGEFDAVIYFPDGFAQQLSQFRADPQRGSQRPVDRTVDSEVKVPRAEIFVNIAKDKSRVAFDRVSAVLRRWREEVVRQNFVASGIPAAAAEPFILGTNDVAEEEGRRGVIWSKMLPFVLLIWALTGAFYPAVDLCVGEKERGTLETLLSSPAERREIVWGKLLTIMVFSMITSLLNLLSMSLTATFIVRQMQQIGPLALRLDLGLPPLAAMGWLLLALVPISALFSALSLALAAFARSTKEGQYYLMPLLLITMPLMMLPMLPAAELDLGNSLIPVTGLMFLLRALMEGEYTVAALYVVPVVAVTAVCCLLAIRWAVDQFNNEAVLFRESERLDPILWLRRLMLDRKDTPTVVQAVFCGLTLLLIRFFVGLLVPMPSSWSGFAQSTLVTQIAMIATPVLLMTIMLTRSPAKTLLLRAPRLSAIPAAILLAVFAHPVIMALGHVVNKLYPISAEVQAQLEPFNRAIGQAPSVWYLLLLLALLPAVCEELAFRGFILSGFRRSGHKWAAIIISSIFFGVAHPILQQSLVTCVIGIAIAYVAVQTRSLLPGILFHMVHNSLGILRFEVTSEVFRDNAILGWLYHVDGEVYVYNTPIVVAGAVLAAAVLFWFRQLPYQPTAEEELQQALDHQSAHVTAP